LHANLQIGKDASRQAGKPTNVQTGKLVSLQTVVPPWDWTAGKVKTSVYTIGKKGVQNGTTTEIYSGVQSACCP